LPEKNIFLKSFRFTITKKKWRLEKQCLNKKIVTTKKCCVGLHMTPGKVIGTSKLKRKVPVT